MFCGDLAMSGSTVYIPSAPSGNVSEYIASVERVAALQPARVLPAHGPPIDDPASLLRAYVRHRMGREAQIIAALREQPTTVDALVNRIYRGLDESLVSRARDTITAHLEKLERDGRAARRDDAWHIIGP
jgi:glyoxylase-like metal-dependent hydrolase (beta-lactamase superfamily II)